MKDLIEQSFKSIGEDLEKMSAQFPQLKEARQARIFTDPTSSGLSFFFARGRILPPPNPGSKSSAPIFKDQDAFEIDVRAEYPADPGSYYDKVGNPLTPGLVLIFPTRDKKRAVVVNFPRILVGPSDWGQRFSTAVRAVIDKRLSDLRHKAANFSEK